MISVARLLRCNTVDDYEEMLAQVDGKLELFFGQIYAMAGATEEHCDLQTAVVHFLTNQLGLASPCKVRSSDLKIGHGHDRLPGHDPDKQLMPFRAFPDISVVCGDSTYIGTGKTKAVCNPKVLFEITSDGTEAFDRDLKWREYARIDSLESVVIVSHTKKQLTIHARVHDWAAVEISEGDFVVPGISARINIDELYRVV